MHVTRRRGQPRRPGARGCSTTIRRRRRLGRPRPTSSSTSAPATTTAGPAGGENVTDGVDRDARRRRSPATPTTSCSCPRRWSTARGRTTRCRSPRTPSCGPTSSSCTPASWPPSRRWPTAGGAPRPAAPSPCCDRSWRWPPTARRRWPPRSAAGLGQRFGEDDPPAQFLHLDDLASAVVARRRPAPRRRVQRRARRLGRRRAGARPDRRAAADPAARPGRRGRRRLRWRFQRGPIPPGLRSYTREPWLVANDRLKAQGWRPTVTNEQAYVEGTEARWWTMITPKRRQELTLGGDGRVARRSRRPSAAVSSPRCGAPAPTVVTVGVELAASTPSAVGVVGAAWSAATVDRRRRRRRGGRRSRSPAAALVGGDASVVDRGDRRRRRRAGHRRRPSAPATRVGIRSCTSPTRSPSSSTTGRRSSATRVVDSVDHRRRPRVAVAVDERPCRRCRRRRRRAGSRRLGRQRDQRSRRRSVVAVDDLDVDDVAASGRRAGIDARRGPSTAPARRDRPARRRRCGVTSGSRGGCSRPAIDAPAPVVDAADLRRRRSVAGRHRRSPAGRSAAGSSVAVVTMSDAADRSRSARAARGPSSDGWRHGRSWGGSGARPRGAA